MEVIEVKTKSQFRRFLKLQPRIYNNHPYYVCPLNMFVKNMIKGFHVPHKHLLIAHDKHQDVARIGFKVHTYKSETFLHFGFFDCMEGYSNAASQLIEYGRNKYPHLPIKGPYHFTMEDPYIGVLVAGFDQEPYFLMPYNFPYYDDYLKKAGLQKAMDLFTYQLTKENIDRQLAPLQPQAQKAQEQDVIVRFPHPKNHQEFKEEVYKAINIFNDALSDNWGFEKFKDAQIKEFIHFFKYLLDIRMTAFAMKDGKEVGCLIMIPNYNQILKSHRGKITPWLLYKYFFRRYKYISSMRGYVLGIKKAYHGMGIGSLLTIKMFQQGVKCGYQTGEVSWILGSNDQMNRLAQTMSKEGKHNKVYRVYEARP